MNEEKDRKPEGSEHDFSEYAKHQRPQSGDKGGEGSGDWFLRVCGWLLRAIGIVLGVVALVFFLVLGACFLSI